MSKISAASLLRGRAHQRHRHDFLSSAPRQELYLLSSKDVKRGDSPVKPVWGDLFVDELPLPSKV